MDAKNHHDFFISNFENSHFLSNTLHARFEWSLSMTVWYLSILHRYYEYKKNYQYGARRPSGTLTAPCEQPNKSSSILRVLAWQVALLLDLSASLRNPLFASNRSSVCTELPPVTITYTCTFWEWSLIPIDFVNNSEQKVFCEKFLQFVNLLVILKYHIWRIFFNGFVYFTLQQLRLPLTNF